MDRRFTRRGRGRCRSAHVNSLGRRPEKSGAAWEPLETRRLMCLDHLVDSGHLSVWGMSPSTASVVESSPPPTTVAASSLTAADVSIAATAPSGLPWLHSLPGAPVAIFLDFD